MSAARWTAERLERGDLLPVRLARTLCAIYETVASKTLERPVCLPECPVVGIGGAVLGGAGKTLVAAAYAQSFAASGHKVALVSHGYRAHSRSPRIVRGFEPASEVGDDAIVAARLLGASGVGVWVGPNRNETLRAASSEADIIVVDGLLQTRPRALARSVLVLDAGAPFGAGACPPAGDLRARPQEIFALCDEVVVVSDVLRAGEAAAARNLVRRQWGAEPRMAWLDLTHARDRNRRVPVESLRRRRVGLLTTLARPDRVVASLERRGVVPVCAWRGADHEPLSASQLRAVRKLAWDCRLDAWVVTTKCVTHLADQDIGSRLLVLEVTTRLDPDPPPVLDSPPCVPEDS